MASTDLFFDPIEEEAQDPRRRPRLNGWYMKNGYVFSIGDLDKKPLAPVGVDQFSAEYRDVAVAEHVKAIAKKSPLDRLKWMSSLGFYRPPACVLRVGIVLAEHVNSKTGNTFLSAQTIASEAGIRRGTVFDAIEWLESRALIFVVRRNRRSSRYFLVNPIRMSSYCSPRIGAETTL